MLCYNCMREKGDARFCPFCGCENLPDTTTHHLPPGAVIGGRYTLGRVLGEGGFGITYIGFDHTLDNLVAIKEYFPYGISHRVNTVSNTVTISAGDQESYFKKGKKRFLNEAKNVARFRKESGIVTVFDFIEENNTAYIVMEYLDGVDLRNYLRQHGALTVDQTLDLLLPVIKSLDKMHAAGIIHRDISPDNLMVLNDGSVKLMDFGAARDFVGDERSMSVMLKKGYAPEEQYRSNGKQGPWTDVYGICATIYRCITGKTPNESLDRIFEDHLKRPSELGVTISPAMENVLLYGLAVRHEDRCQSMAELYRLLNEARQQPASFAPQPTPLPVSAQPVSTQPVPTQPLPVQPVPQRPAAPAQNLYQDNRTQAADDAPLVQPSAPPAWSPAPPPGSVNYPVAPSAADMPQKKRSPAVPIIIASVATVLTVALIVLLIVKPFDSDRSSSSNSYYSYSHSTSSLPESSSIEEDDEDDSSSSSSIYSSSYSSSSASGSSSSKSIDEINAQPVGKFTVAETNEDGTIFQATVDYVFDRITTSDYQYDNYISDSFPLSENGCYQADPEKDFFVTRITAKSKPSYGFTTDVEIEGKSYKLGTSTLKDFLDNGWSYSEEPEANSDSQSVDLKSGSKELTVYIDKTGSDPKTAVVTSIYLDGPGDSSGAPSFKFGKFSDNETLDSAGKTASPSDIRIHSGFERGEIGYEYANYSEDVIVSMEFAYDPSAKKCSLISFNINYYD